MRALGRPKFEFVGLASVLGIFGCILTVAAFAQQNNNQPHTAASRNIPNLQKSSTLFAADVQNVAVGNNGFGQSSGNSNERIPLSEQSLRADSLLEVSADEFSGALTLTAPVRFPESKGKLPILPKLSYNSFSPDGPVGIGWKLGSSYITRNTRKGLNYSAQDFVLILGGNSAELATLSPGKFVEVTPQTRILAAQVQASDGNSAWVVTDIYGTQYFFGSSVASRLSLPNGTINTWYLDYALDLNGNKITYSYIADHGSILVSQVSYASNANATRDAENNISFGYEMRPDQHSDFSSLFEAHPTQRLSSVQVVSHGQPLVSYKLQYKQSNYSGRSLLTTITESNGAISLPPVTLSYNDSTPSVSLPPAINNPFPSTGSYSTSCIPGDFNGDGRTDLTCYSAQTKQWSVGLSTGHSLTASTWSGFPQPANPPSNPCLSGDFNADGKTDLACYSGSNGAWIVGLSTGTSWNSSTWANGPAPGAPVSGQCASGDFNGDGKTDIVCYTGSNGQWVVSLSTGSGWSTSVWPSGVAPGLPIANQCFISDFNGDLKADIACYTGASGTWAVALSTGSSFQSQSWTAGPAPSLPIRGQCISGDFNGDGLTDIACIADTAGNWNILFSAGNTWTAQTWPNGPIPKLPNFQDTIHAVGLGCIAADFDGDGKTDLGCWQQIGAGASVVTKLSSGAGWRQATFDLTPQFHFNAPDCFAGDIAGTRRASWICGNADSTVFSMSLMSGDSTDLLQSVKNSYGGVTNAKYSWTSQKTPSAMPISLPVLTTLARMDGRSPTQSITQFAYESGFYHTQEREYRGFNHVTTQYPSDYYGSQLIKDQWFHQGNDLAPDQNTPSDVVGLTLGKPYRVRLSNKAGKSLQEQTFTYTTAALFPNYTPVSIATLTFFGTGTANSTSTLTSKYDGVGNVVEQTDLEPSSNTTQITSLTYAPAPGPGFIAAPLSYEVKDENGKTLSHTTYVYDGPGCNNEPASPGKWNLTSLVRSIQSDTSDTQYFSYNSFGRITCAQDALGNQTLYTYDQDGDFIQKLINPLKQTTEYQYYGISGTPLQGGRIGLMSSAQDPNGNKITYLYDDLGRPTEVDDRDNTWTKWAYLNFGDPAKQSVTLSRTDGGQKQSFIDGFGRAYQVKTTSSSALATMVSRLFDTTGRVFAKNGPDAVGALNVDSLITLYRFDELGRILTVSYSNDGRVDTSCYDGLSTGRLDPAGRLQRKTRDMSGYLMDVYIFPGHFTTCSAAGAVAMSVQDQNVLQNSFSGPVLAGAATHLAALMPANINDIQPYVTRHLSYDAMHQLVSVTDAKSVLLTKYGYDQKGDITDVTDPDRGHTQFEYDNNGHLSDAVSDSGIRSRYTRDLLGRISAVSIADPGSSKPVKINYTYDIGANGIGYLTSQTNGLSTDEFAYDQKGRPISVLRQINGKSYPFLMAYNSNGDLRHVSYPNKVSVSYSYDMQLLSGITIGDSQMIKVADYDQFAESQTTTFPNGLQKTDRYFANPSPSCLAGLIGYLCTTQINNGNVTVWSQKYTYDRTGNVLHESGTSSDTQFGYDSLQRVLGSGLFALDLEAHAYAKEVAALTPVQPSNVQGINYSYDGETNRTSSSLLGQYKYGTQSVHVPQSVGKIEVVTDPTGRIVRRDKDTFRYDAANELVAVTHLIRRSSISRLLAINAVHTSILYDASGVPVEEQAERVLPFRIGKWLPKSRQDDVSAYYRCQGSRCTDVIYGQGVPVATQEGDRLSFLHFDRSGSLVAQSDSAAHITVYPQTGIFGELGNRNPHDGSFLYAGNDWKPGLGLYAMGVRFYDPTVGMFLTQDPSMKAAYIYGNGYTYARNNPLRYVDPTGRDDDEGEKGGDNDDKGNAGGNNGSGEPKTDNHVSVDSPPIGNRDSNSVSNPKGDPRASDSREKGDVDRSEGGQQSSGGNSSARDSAGRDPEGRQGGGNGSGQIKSSNVNTPVDFAKGVADGLSVIVSKALAPSTKFFSIVWKLDPYVSLIMAIHDLPEVSPSELEFDPPLPPQPIAYPSPGPGPTPVPAGQLVVQPLQ